MLLTLGRHLNRELRQDSSNTQYSQEQDGILYMAWRLHLSEPTTRPKWSGSAGGDSNGRGQERTSTTMQTTLTLDVEPGTSSPWPSTKSAHDWSRCDWPGFVHGDGGDGGDGDFVRYERLRLLGSGSQGGA